MIDLCLILKPLTFAFCAALTGLGAAHLASIWFARRKRRAKIEEAAFCAFLAPLAVLFLPLMVWLSFFPLAHWARHIRCPEHDWHAIMHRIPVAHIGLHLANFALLIFAVTRVAVTIRDVGRMLASLSDLRVAARHHEALGQTALRLYILPSFEPLCFTAGLLRPAVYLSDGLASRLSDEHKEAMLAHEAAHARRLDALMGLFLTVFYSIFCLPGARELVVTWRQAAEEACDAEAARRVGDPRPVAAALVAVARIMSGPRIPVPESAAFAANSEDELESRVYALLELAPPGTERRRRRGMGYEQAIQVTMLLSVMGGEYLMRHAVEMFVHH